jgi:bacterioferritin-associated ferredoxin
MEIFQAFRKLRKVDLGASSSRLTDEVLQSVAADCPLLEHLSLCGCSTVSDTAIRTVVESWTLLQFVNLKRTNITDATVVSMCNRCPLSK